MTAAHYYNEFEPYAAEWLRNLIKAGLIPAGDVDTRSIKDVRPDDLKKYTQCHFFAGIGGWPLALQRAGWDANRPVWTGSCPCQPFSSAGKQKGGADDRHLWPVWFDLIRECRPPAIFGEQVASAISHGWLDGVFVDLEREGYSCGSSIIPACAVDAPHRRDRLWFVAYSEGERGGKRKQNPASCGETINYKGQPEFNLSRSSSLGDPSCRLIQRGEPRSNLGTIPGGNGEGLSLWGEAEWTICGDGKARRIPSIKSGICIVAHGVPARVGKLRAFGNAIVPEEAGRFIIASELARGEKIT